MLNYSDLVIMGILLADMVIGPVCSLYILAGLFRKFWREKQGKEPKGFPLTRFIGFINMIPALTLLLTSDYNGVHEWFLLILWGGQVLIGLLPWVMIREWSASVRRRR